MGNDLKIAIISLGSTSSKWTYEECAKLFGKADMVQLKHIEINFSGKNSEVLYNGDPLGEYDCIYAKGSFRYAQLLHSITSITQEKCYMPIQAKAFTAGHDKLLSQLEFNNLGIPMPRTYITSTPEAGKDILKKMHYPIIMKFPDGTHGKGVIFAESYNSASSMLDALTALQQPFMIQEYVDTGGTDIRALVVGEECVAAMERKAATGETRANIHQGGTGASIELDPETKNIAIKTAKAIGADICAVDILVDKIKGPLVIEVNLSPGLQGITNATGINVAEKIAKFLYKKINEIKSQGKEKDSKEILEEIEEKDENKEKEIITQLDLRGSRVLLPEVVTKLTGFNDTDDYVIKAKKKTLNIEKLSIGDSGK